MNAPQKVKLVSFLPENNRGGPKAKNESFWAEAVGGGQYRLLSIPGADPDLNYHDIVTAEARQYGGLTVLQITGIVRRGGQRTFGMWLAKAGLFDRQRKAEQKALLETLREDLGAHLEKGGKHSYGVSVLAARSDATSKLLVAALNHDGVPGGAVDAWHASGVTNRWAGE